MLTAELVSYLIDDPSHPAAPTIANWIDGSNRVREFVAANRSKIRKKLRDAANDEALSDVLAELEAAACLLREKRFALAYETYRAGGGRGPDFTVTFKTHTPFTVEVTRLRSSNGDGEALAGRCAEVALAKLGQLPPNLPNVLLIAAPAGVGEPALDAAMRRLRAEAEHGSAEAEAFFARRGFAGARDVRLALRRLSGLLLRGGAPALWRNPQARHPLAEELRLALVRAFGA